MKHSGIMKRTILCAAFLLACLSVEQKTAYAGAEETMCRAFIEQKLQSGGGVFTNYLQSQGIKEWATGHDVLSESQGLLLTYYVRAGNTDMAAKTIDFVRDNMDTGSILSYRLDESGRVSPSNAAVDDLRLIGAMLEAADIFRQPSYRDQALYYAGRLYGTNVRGDMLADFYDDLMKMAGSDATLCYADLHTMQALSGLDGRWQAVMENMRGILQNGYLGDAFPMFHKAYNMGQKSYQSQNVPMVESLLTAYHLSRVGSCPKQTIAYLKKALQSGKLYAVYDFDGNPLSETESTAIYALCALLGASEDDADLYKSAVDHMLPFQVTEPNSQVYGAFADAQTLQAYSFDNLMALLALQAGNAFPVNP